MRQSDLLTLMTREGELEIRVFSSSLVRAKAPR